MGQKVQMSVYHNGTHFIGKFYTQRGLRREYQPQDSHRKRMRAAFRTAYNEAVGQGLKQEDMREYIRESFPELLQADGYDPGADVFAMHDNAVYEEFVKDTVHMMYLRKKRFRRKAFLNEWNYFVTLTYDDNKMTAEEFVPAVRKALSNFHSRYGWNYCAVFEEGAEGGRIHLHAMVYIPEGAENGTFKLVPQWSTKRMKREYRNSHSYFEERFGHCDFKPIAREDMQRTVNYLTKYMTKTDTGMIYSRGVPDELRDMEIDLDDVFFVVKRSCGYLAILADSATGMHENDRDTEALFFDLGVLDCFHDRFIEQKKSVV